MSLLFFSLMSFGIAVGMWWSVGWLAPRATRVLLLLAATLLAATVWTFISPSVGAQAFVGTLGQINGVVGLGIVAYVIYRRARRE